jgi:hypothetical protein
MSNDSRKARLAREALGEAGGDTPAAQGTLWVIAALVVVLFAAGAVFGPRAYDDRVAAASSRGAR